MLLTYPLFGWQNKIFLISLDHKDNRAIKYQANERLRKIKSRISEILFFFEKNMLE